MNRPRPLTRRGLFVVWCAALVVIGFFLPWATLDIGSADLERSIARSVRKAGGKGFRGGRSEVYGRKNARVIIPNRVSGAQVPFMANSKHAKVATRLMKVFTKSEQHLGLKSFAVYLLPLLACAAAAVLVRWPEHRGAVAAVAVVCLAIAGYGSWTLLTTNTRKLYALSIGFGLWISLLGHAGLAVAAIAPKTVDKLMVRM